MARSLEGLVGSNYIHPAGDRTQSFDLQISSRLHTDPFLSAVGLPAGKYEVKSLWRRSDGGSFDRRFKVGQRGERIYGRRDTEIKAFAQALEDEIDNIVEHSVDPGKDEYGRSYPRAKAGTVTRTVEDIHGLVDLAMERKHSKAFMERILRLARASLSIPRLTIPAHRVITGGVQGPDIMKGFDDIEGIFVVAGPMYTLITRTEMPEFLAFDSASSEGPKLRLVSVIPSEGTKARKEKGKKAACR